jgi:UDP-3-O-[3-hydroxymyristoyl] N-acetylglucosamine deacetylase
MRVDTQTTLGSRATISGIGVHSGSAVTLNLYPASSDAGVVFVRSGAHGASQREIRASVGSVTATELATVLGDASGPGVSTIEHIMAALCGMGVDNAVIEIDGPEAPILDGSAAPFGRLIDEAGIVPVAAPRRYTRVLKPIRVSRGDAFGELRPYDHGFRVEVEIEFEDSIIGRQSLALDVKPEMFRRELARARTFGFLRDVSKLWGAGYALGASLENTVVVNGDRILNPEGLRFPDEFVRHKTLDAIGDLALAGAPILGAYRSIRGGHKLNHAVLTALIADPSAWAITERSKKRFRGYAEGVVSLATPA